jgi:small conductance mechanosensitive channel
MTWLWEDAILKLADVTWRNLEVSGTGLAQALEHAAEVLKALFTPRALELWPLYFLAVCGWSLFCLAAAWLVRRRWARPPAAPADPEDLARLKFWLRHTLVAASPILLLIVSLSLWPELSSTVPGVTADLALSFIFLHTLVKYLFINCSILYLALKAASDLLIPDGGGAKTLSGLPAPLALRVFSAWRFLAVYLTIMAFVKEIFLDQFVLGRTYSVSLLVLVLPVPLVLTVQLWRLRGHLASVAGGGGGESPAAEQPAYLTDQVFRKCWVFLGIGLLWLAAWAYLAGTAGFFARLMASLAVFGLALGAVKAARFLLRSLGKPALSDEGRRLLINLDVLVGLAVSLIVGGLFLTVWGLPLGRVLGNSLAREILGRFLVIAMTFAVLVLFLKFSRLAAEWLLAVPSLSGNRNWRTLAPLALTGARALCIFLASVVVLERLGVDVGPILAGAGILGLGVGLGAQSLVKDLINGISILALDIIAVGDYVTIGGQSGTVEQVGLRSLRLRDSYWNLILIPNSRIDIVINKTRGLSRSLLEVVMPPDADPDELLALARAVADDFNADAEWGASLVRPVKVVGVTSFDPDGTTIRLELTARAGEQWEPEWELKRRLKQRLLQAGHNSLAFARVVVNLSRS